MDQDTLHPTSRPLDKSLLRSAAVTLDGEAERLTERLQMSLTERHRREVVERRAKLWRTIKLLREIAE